MRTKAKLSSEVADLGCSVTNQTDDEQLIETVAMMTMTKRKMKRVVVVGGTHVKATNKHSVSASSPKELIVKCDKLQWSPTVSRFSHLTFNQH